MPIALIITKYFAILLCVYLTMSLIRVGFRVMPYSTGCATPLSNFEATQDYKDVQDPAITVCFPMDDDPKVNIIAWTTTPWTLPSNLALCVHPDLDYVKVKVNVLNISSN